LNGKYTGVRVNVKSKIGESIIGAYSKVLIYRRRFLEAGGTNLDSAHWDAGGVANLVPVE